MPRPLRMKNPTCVPPTASQFEGDTASEASEPEVHLDVTPTPHLFWTLDHKSNDGYSKTLPLSLKKGVALLRMLQLPAVHTILQHKTMMGLILGAVLKMKVVHWGIVTTSLR